MTMREDEDEVREEEGMRKDANAHSHQLCSLSHDIEPIIHQMPSGVLSGVMRLITSSPLDETTAQ